MNNLFLYRLTIIFSQLLLLMFNHWWSFYNDIHWGLWIICLAFLLWTLVAKFLQNKHHQSRYMLVVDLLLWSSYFYFIDGVSNPLIWCLLIPSVLSALSQSVQYTWLMTASANLVYLGLWQTADIFHNNTTEHMHGNMMQQHVLGMWLGFIAVSVLLTWVTTSLLRRINDKNQVLLCLEQQRQADENILKMATLATSLAHELGSPLNSIKLLVNELKLSTNDAAQITDLDMLDSQVERCKNALQEITAVTDDSQSQQSQVISDIDFVEQLIAAIGQQDVLFTVKKENQQVTLLEVDHLLHLACLNVLNNSLAAGANQISIRIEKTNHHLQLLISDDGEGQDHHNPSGLGIGLKLSKRIIESIGGQLQFNFHQHGAETQVLIPIKVA